MIPPRMHKLKAAPPEGTSCTASPHRAVRAIFSAPEPIAAGSPRGLTPLIVEKPFATLQNAANSQQRENILIRTQHGLRSWPEIAA